MTNILLIGCGNMGGAMLARWCTQTYFSFTVADPNASNLPTGVVHITEASQLNEQQFDVVILAIKPQLFDAVLPDYSNALAADGLVLSIAAGVSVDTIGSYFADAAIVRVMPNLPAFIGKSMSGAFATPSVSTHQRDVANSLLNATGDAIWVDSEDAINRITAVSGSGPGYVFYLIEAYIDAAVALGFSAEDARTLVLNTLAGSVQMAQESTKSAASLRASVTSKAGTTEAGLNELMANDTLKNLLNDTLNAAYNRAVELS